MVVSSLSVYLHDILDVVGDNEQDDICTVLFVPQWLVSRRFDIHLRLCGHSAWRWACMHCYDYGASKIGSVDMNWIRGTYHLATGLQLFTIPKSTGCLLATSSVDKVAQSSSVVVTIP